MLSGPAAITGQLPGRSSYNSSVDTDVYGDKLLIIYLVICQESSKISLLLQIQLREVFSKTTRNTMI